MVDIKELADDVINGKAPQVKELVKKALDEGVEVEKILNEGLMAMLRMLLLPSLKQKNF